MNRAFVAAIALLLLTTTSWSEESNPNSGTTPEQAKPQKQSTSKKHRHRSPYTWGIAIDTPKRYSPERLKRMIQRSGKALGSVNVNYDTQSAAGKFEGFTQHSSTRRLNAKFYPTVKTVTDESGDPQALKSDPSFETSEVLEPNYELSRGPGAFEAGNGYGLSSLSLLQQQMQLTYELVNYQYLFAESQDAQNEDRESVLIGFDISVQPDEGRKNYLAQVTFELQEGSTEPSILAMFPLKNTYNSINFVEDLSQIGTGLVLGPVSLGGSGSSSEQKGYIVKDSDVVALHLPEKHPPDGDYQNNTKFGWQFRPVLGREFVEPGIRRVFVMFSFPKGSLKTPRQLQFKVKTAWLRVDRKTHVAENETIRDGNSTEFVLASATIRPSDKSKPYISPVKFGKQPTKMQKELYSKGPVDKKKPWTLRFVAEIGSGHWQDFQVVLNGQKLQNVEHKPIKNRPEEGKSSTEQSTEPLKTHFAKIIARVPAGLVKDKNSSLLTIANEWGKDTVELKAILLPDMPEPPKYKAYKNTLVLTGPSVNSKYEALVNGLPYSTSRGNMEVKGKTAILYLPQNVNPRAAELFCLISKEPITDEFSTKK